MDKQSLLDRILEILDGDNGAAYYGISGIVLIVAARYGYRIIKKSGNDELLISADIDRPALEENAQ